MNKLIGKRITLIQMKDDPDPLPQNSMGTIIHIGGGVINVKWDNGRTLGLVIGVDEYKIID